MGSAKDPTKTARTARVQPNTVCVGDLPPVSSGTTVSEDLSVVISLLDVAPEIWLRLNVGDAVVVLTTALPRLEVRSNGEYLGVVPPQYAETVLERQLFFGSCVVVGRGPSDLRVRLSSAE
jgi:hypothetical protein